MLEPYKALATAIKEHGFYTTGLERMGDWNRITICSERRPGIGYSGNSFWVSYLAGCFYLGTWGGMLYRLPDESRITELCIEWLSRELERTKADFDEALKLKYDLIEIADDDFDDIAGKTIDQN